MNNDDDSVEYENLSAQLNDINDSEKNNFIKNVKTSKELLLLEINKNKILRENKRNKQITYILKHPTNTIDLSMIIVDMLEDKELQILYDKVVYENRSIFKKLIEFMFYN
jgi:hypothetical protein